MFFNCPKIKRILLSNCTVTFYVLNNNNVFYTQVASAYIPDNTDASFLFLLQ